MPTELKTWAAAYTHTWEDQLFVIITSVYRTYHSQQQTLGLSISSHLGVKKYWRPVSAPGSVQARMVKMRSSTSGSVAVTYTTLPVTFTLQGAVTGILVMRR